MTRLPVVGSDDGVWGAILNEYLLVEHNPDGTQKPLLNPTLTGTVDASTAGMKVKAMIPPLPTVVVPANNIAVFNLTVNNRFSVSLSGNTTFVVMGDLGGQPIMIRIVSNGNTVNWWSGITWSGGAVPALTPGGKADWVYLQRTGDNTYDGALGFGNL